MLLGACLQRASHAITEAIVTLGMPADAHAIDRRDGICANLARPFSRLASPVGPYSTISDGAVG